VYTGGVGKGFAISYVTGFARVAGKHLPPLMQKFNVPRNLSGEKINRLLIPVPLDVTYRRVLTDYDPDHIHPLAEHDNKHFQFKVDSAGQRSRPYNLMVYRVDGTRPGQMFYVCVDLGGIISNLKNLAEEYNFNPTRVAREVIEYVTHLNNIFKAEQINAEAFTFDGDETLYMELLDKCIEADEAQATETYTAEDIGGLMAEPVYYTFLKLILECGAGEGEESINDQFQRKHQGPTRKSNTLFVIVPESCKTKECCEYNPSLLRSAEALKMIVNRPGQKDRTYNVSVLEVANPLVPEEKVLVMVTFPQVLNSFEDMVKVNHIPGGDWESARKAFSRKLATLVNEHNNVKVLDYDDENDDLADLIYQHASIPN
jgi:hypothetical protein